MSDDKPTISVLRLKAKTRNTSGIRHDGTPTTKHGFYRKKMDEEEAVLAERLHADIKKKYALDDLVDDLMLYTGISNFIKSLRKEPSYAGQDHNVRDAQAWYERQFRECLKDLALTRAARKDDAKTDSLANELAGLFTKRTDEAPPEDEASP